MNLIRRATPWTAARPFSQTWHTAGRLRQMARRIRFSCAKACNSHDGGDFNCRGCQGDFRPHHLASCRVQ